MLTSTAVALPPAAEPIIIPIHTNVMHLTNVIISIHAPIAGAGGSKEAGMQMSTIHLESSKPG